MDRVDVLASDPGARYRALTGRVLDVAPDDTLQALAAQTARALDAPRAAITLVLEHTVLFRAHAGLPPDIAAGIDRDASFCQWVVHDRAPVIAGDLAGHPLMPQRAVEIAGVRAYAGAPVRIGAVVVGALAVFADQPRAFSAVDVAALQVLAARVSDRLAALAGPPRAPRTRGAQAVLGDLQSGLVPLKGDVARARVLAVDADAPARALRAGVPPHPLLTHGSDAAVELAAVLRDIESAATDLEEDVGLLELALAADEGGASLDEVLAFADGLARRLTSARGGVRWAAVDRRVLVRASRHVAAGVLAATLGEVALRQTNEGGTDAYIKLEPGAVAIHLDAALDRSRAAACAHAVDELLGPHPCARVDAAGPLVVVRLVRAWDC